MSTPHPSLSVMRAFAAMTLLLHLGHQSYGSMTPAARRSPRVRGLYDGGVTQFSPDGAMHQVQYAEKAVDRGEPALAAIIIVDGRTNSSNESLGTETRNESMIEAASGIVLAARCVARGPRCLRILPEGDIKGSESADTASNRKRDLDKGVLVGPRPSSRHFEKLHIVDDHVVCAVAGLTPDALALMKEARKAAHEHRRTWGAPIPIAMLARRIANVAQACTQYGGQRPYGAALLLAGWDERAQCFTVAVTDPSGNYRIVDGSRLRTSDASASSLDKGSEASLHAAAGEDNLSDDGSQQEKVEKPVKRRLFPSLSEWIWSIGAGRDNHKLRHRFENVMKSRVENLSPRSLATASEVMGTVLLEIPEDKDDGDSGESEEHQGAFVEYASIFVRSAHESYETEDETSSPAKEPREPTIVLSSSPLREADMKKAPTPSHIRMLK